MKTERFTIQRFDQFLLVLIIVLLAGSCNNNSSEQIPGDVVFIPESAEGDTDTTSLPVITFEQVSHDFGRMIQGEIVTYAFKFTNTGGSDLVISNITATCGCTATDYPKEPVEPGESDYVKVTFNSSGKKGFQNKAVTIAANTQPTTTHLYVRATVVTPEN